MFGFVAWIVAMLALIATPTTATMDRIDARLTALENKQCTLMIVSTPTGQTTICATTLKEPRP